MTQIRMTCSCCGSTDVKADAYAVWDEPTQQWVLAFLSDKGAICENCDGETRIVEVEIEGTGRVLWGGRRALTRRNHRPAEPGDEHFTIPGYDAGVPCA